MQGLNEKAPVWVPLLRLVLAVVLVGGGVTLAWRWGSTGYTVAAWVCLAAMLGGLAGLYPDEKEID